MHARTRAERTTVAHRRRQGAGREGKDRSPHCGSDRVLRRDGSRARRAPRLYLERQPARDLLGGVRRLRVLRRRRARAVAGAAVDDDAHVVNIRRFPAMGCLVEVGGATRSEALAIERIFQARDRQYSRFSDKSELSRVNRTPREIVTVSKTFGQMVERALAAASATGGLVDPTLAAALAAAGYDRDFEALEPRADPARAGAPGRW